MKKELSISILITMLMFLQGWSQRISSDTLLSFPLDNYILKSQRTNYDFVDHRQFEELNVDFEDAHAVTEACLSCHNGRGIEIMQTSHWQWQREEELEGKGVVPLGKRNILNNFCIGVSGSEATCTRCHIGYGYKDKNFDFSDQNNIDCLVCHDQTDKYKKGKGIAGYPDPSVDLTFVAKNIGIPRKENCGVCHFWGGGGNNVKHGDLDIAMLNCSKDIDVHMAKDGEDMTCTECHLTENHQMSGKLYALSSENRNRMSCEHCHTNEPHESNIINEHMIRIACQTCHIPYYAKANDTKIIWNWENAGELDDHHHPIHENDMDGNHKYMGIKGTFIWDNNIVPEYYWFNGIANHQLITDKIDTVPVQMNSLDGSYKDKGIYQKSIAPSKIWPVKVHRGNQIYDPVNNTLIQPKLWDKEPGQGAYWVDFDWDIAAQKGMDYLGLPYSGQYDFIETEMYWPLNHQISPASESLTCIDCHTRNNGRLSNLNDFYLPGRDYNATLEGVAMILILLTISGCIGHGICRWFFGGNCPFRKN